MDTLPEYERADVKIKKMLRDRLLEEGLLHEATSAAKKNGVQCKAAISRALFQELYPYAEDANHGVSWEEILYDMFKIFKRNFKDSRSTYGEFGINTKTYVKEIYKTLNEESLPLIFPDGQPRDKRVDVFISWMPDENLEPSLVFGLKSSKFF